MIDILQAGGVLRFVQDLPNVTRREMISPAESWSHSFLHPGNGDDH